MAEVHLHQHRHAVTHDIITKSKMPTGIVKKDRQRRKQNVSENSKQKAFAAALAATVLSDMYCSQSKTPRQSEQQQQEEQHSSGSMSSSASFGVSEKLFGDRNLPSYCSSLAGESDPRGYIAFSATEDDCEIDAMKFDDTECISVNRTPGMRGRSQNIITVATDLIGPESDENAEDSMAIEPISFREEFSLKQQNVHATTVELSPRSATASPEFEFEEVDLSEHLNIHFAVLTPRQKRCSDEIICDDEDDNMSIITDISMIPTYCPSDVMQHQQRSRAVTLLGRLFKAKASAAKKTVRQFKRSCRGVMENTFAESNTYRPTKCVRVGEAF